MDLKPLAVDLCCGLGGWSEGLLAEGWDVIGFDVERHKYGSHQYPAQLVLQDILTLDGRQFRGLVSLIVASPPCQEFSYMAMPWTRAKMMAAALRGDGEFPDGYTGSRTVAELTALFDACVRIGREAGCPIVIENVRGAIPWVGRSRWNFGSFHLWGSVPALMPITLGRKVMKRGVAHRASGETNFHGVKVGMGTSWYPPDDPRHIKGLGFNTIADRQTREMAEGVKVGDVGWRRDNDISSQTFIDAAANGVKIGGSAGDDWFTHHNRPEFEERATKNDGGPWFNVAHNAVLNNNPARGDGTKQGGDWFNAASLDGDGQQSISRRSGSKSSARKAASARIAVIPIALARHIARTYYPR